MTSTDAIQAPADEPTSTRREMSDFWKAHAAAGVTVEQMMLTVPGQNLEEEDRQEILSALPDWSGLDVIELGGGIGRFTGHLATKASRLISVEFMKEFYQANLDANGSRPNLTLINDDATTVSFPAGSADLVFSNWLLMYLSDEECFALLSHALAWLREGAHLFFRESCFHPSRGVDCPIEPDNPTRYRPTSAYSDLLAAATCIDPVTGRAFGFEIDLCRSVQAYCKHRSIPNQIFWLVRKVCRSSSGAGGDDAAATAYSTFREFLDSQQYSRNGILRYEKVFGDSFVSAGGQETIEKLLDGLTFTPGQTALDFGCGLGGNALYLIKKFGMNVTGVDLSTNMLNIAMERRFRRYKNDIRLNLEIADGTQRHYSHNSFDLIFSRDVILHIQDKLSLFKNFFNFLKPGGYVAITDYCRGDGKHSDRFRAYVKQRGYHLLTPAQYGQLLADAGFQVHRADDTTDWFMEILRRELDQFIASRDAVAKDFTEEDFNSIVTGWREKLVRCADGDQKWGAFIARKPLESSG